MSLEQRLHREQHLKSLEKAIGGKPDVVYLMSGGIAGGAREPYKSTSMRDPELADGRKFGYLGGVLRVHAVAELYRHFPQATIVTSSTVNGISHAEVQARELHALWDNWDVVPPEVIREEKSNSSRTELAELVRLIVDRAVTGRVLVVTSDYHVERVEKTLEHLPQLMEEQDPSFAEVWEKFKERKDVSIKVQDAETVLRTVNPKFDKMLGTVFEKEPWKSDREKRVAAERNGVEAIGERTYDSRRVREE